jgi:1,4-alpha-glucan branching enzyme
MKRALWTAAIVLGLACGGQPGDELADDGAIVSSGDALTTTQQQNIAYALNDPRSTYAALTKFGLATTAAKNLIAHRDGPDGVYPSADDNTFDNYAEVDAVPYVGSTALSRLNDWASSLGYVDSSGNGSWDNVTFTPAQQQKTIKMVNLVDKATLTSSTKVYLTSTQANTIIAARPISSMDQLSALSGIGTTAMTKLRNYSDKWTPPLTSSSRPGMGATLYSGGVTFRVYAPNATQVWVTGDFNGWGRTELGNEFNGNFSADVDGAQHWQKYKYVLLSKYGETLYKQDPRSERLENSTGNSIIADPGYFHWNNSFSMPGKNETVVYELHIGTMNDSPGYGPGNFQSATAMLDHVAALGVNMIEVMPVSEFAGDFSYGYNPAYPFSVESAYGTPEDFKNFIDQAHKRGMGVMLDVVANHWGPSDLSMWCFSGDCYGAGGEYFYADWRNQTPWGNSRPDYGRNEVRDYIKDMAMMWLNEYHLDGLRWDSTQFMRSSNGGDTNLPDGYGLLQWINDIKNSSQPWKLMIAEDFGGDFVTQSTGAGGMGFDGKWDTFFRPLRNAVVTQNDSDRDLNSLAGAISYKPNGDAFRRVIYDENHDEDSNGHSRLPEEIWPGNTGSWAAKKRQTLAAAIVMTSPGIPMLFEGQEVDMYGHFAAENPVDWSLLNSYSGINQLYTDLVHLRRNWNNNTRGLRGQGINVFHVDNTSHVMAYHRWDQGGAGDDVVVVANFSGNPLYNYTVGMPRCGMWNVRFNSDWNGYSSDFGNTTTYGTNANSGGYDGLPCNANVTIGPYTAVIFSQ